MSDDAAASDQVEGQPQALAQLLSAFVHAELASEAGADRAAWEREVRRSLVAHPREHAGWLAQLDAWEDRRREIHQRLTSRAPRDFDYAGEAASAQAAGDAERSAWALTMMKYKASEAQRREMELAAFGRAVRALRAMLRQGPTNES